MADSWFVTPNTTQIDLAGGEWIEVKNELTAKEERALTIGAMRTLHPNGTDIPDIVLDHEKLAFGKVLAYLVDWSLKDAKGKKVPVTPASVGALKGEKLKTIEQSIDEHIARVEADTAADPIGATDSGATSPSVAS